MDHYSAPYCGACGYDFVNRNVGDKDRCDSCGADTQLYGYGVATAGAPGTIVGYTPADIDEVAAFVASPTTAWTIGQYVDLGDASDAYWDGTAWAAGIAA